LKVDEGYPLLLGSRQRGILYFFGNLLTFLKEGVRSARLLFKELLRSARLLFKELLKGSKETKEMSEGYELRAYFLGVKGVSMELRAYFFNSKGDKRRVRICSE
jgi:hypothetical protein